jgi:hypothetical protein
VPDLHGSHMDERAVDSFFKDVTLIDPQEIVLLGDVLDCGGTFSSHGRRYTNELAESYVDDIAAANHFLDVLQKKCPKASIYMLEGNHEFRVESWATQEFPSQKDAELVLERLGPESALQLKARGIRYYRRCRMYMGLSVPGTIRLGCCFFTHGITACRHAAAEHLRRFSANVVFGHTHRSQGIVERTVTSNGFGAWSPGTLSKLQPLYRHTTPTNWSHGYAVQSVAKSGLFLHVNVPILKKGESLLKTLVFPRA